MQDFIESQIEAGTYINTDEAIRAGVRLLMEKDGARQFYNLKSELSEAMADVDAGNFKVFDSIKYEPKSFSI